MEYLKSIIFKNSIFKHSVVQNTFWLYLSEIIGKSIKALLLIFIIKVLGPKNYGVFEYLLSFIGIFFLFADFGSSNIFIRDYQQQEENREKHISTFFWIKVLLSIIFSFLALLGYFFSKKIDSFLFYSFFVLFYVLSNIEGFFASFFIACQKTNKKFIFNLFNSLFLPVAVISALFIYPHIYSIITAYVLSEFLTLILAYNLFRQEAEIKKIFDIQLIKYYLNNGLPLVLFGLLGFIFFTTDKIILAHLRPIEEVGYYSLTSRVIGVLLTIPNLLNIAFYPYLSKKVGEKHNLLKFIFVGMVVSSMILGFILALGVYFLSPIVIHLFFADKYNLSIPILQTFIWILILIFPTCFLDYFLVSNNKQWLDFYITIIPALSNIILDIILIPRFGVLGAVYGSMLAQLLNFLLTFGTSFIILQKIVKF